jgi:hypothetical protein
MVDLVLQFSISSNPDELADSPTEDVYLFLCPANLDDSSGRLAVHLPPKRDTYYWSFDSKGTKVLPQNTLDKLNLPHVNFCPIVCGTRWSKEVYDSLGEFHCAKGFNPVIEVRSPLVDVDRLPNLLNGGKVSTSFY